jgi:hypothetical protein
VPLIGLFDKMSRDLSRSTKCDKIRKKCLLLMWSHHRDYRIHIERENTKSFVMGLTSAEDEKSWSIQIIINIFISTMKV